MFVVFFGNARRDEEGGSKARLPDSPFEQDCVELRVSAYYYPRLTLLFKAHPGRTRNPHNSYGNNNPITRRGISVPVVRSHDSHPPLMAGWSGVPDVMTPQMAPFFQKFRRIRNPRARGYQPYPREGLPTYPESQSMPLSSQQHGAYYNAKPGQHTSRPIDMVRHHRETQPEAEWEDSSRLVAPPTQPYQYSRLEATPIPRGPPPPRFSMPESHGLGRFQGKIEMDDIEAVEAEWDQKLHDEISLAIDTESFDPQAQQTQCTPLLATPQTSQNNTFPSYSYQVLSKTFPGDRGLLLPQRPSSDRRQPKSLSPLDIAAHLDEPVDSTIFSLAPTPRHQSIAGSGAGAAFPFDPPLVAAGNTCRDWEHLDDTPYGLTGYQRKQIERSNSQIEKICGKTQASDNAFHTEWKMDHYPLASGACQQATMESIEISSLRFFNNGQEVDIDGRPISRPQSPPLWKMMESDISAPETDDEGHLVHGCFQ